MSSTIKLDLDQVIRQALQTAATPPQTRTEPALPRWTLKRLVLRLWEKFQIKCCRNTVRQVLKYLGFSWKKARKLLNKANLSGAEKYSPQNVNTVTRENSTRWANPTRFF